ncbi:unnamed protein product [Spodoptera exigua]|uniref:Mitochondrial 2-oxodicarboxylate carrier n=1 Tax=Spodoptera exigua TaxID=7107 RepID=A0A922SQ17_SPOEX|nr:hypothetical protein HF086_005696 [Spodoptera exigua]CAH0686454.1 unnamed protein product [Spodoptera exigua]
MSDMNTLLKQAAMQIGAGGSAGFVEVLIMQPLDLIKTRLQLQATNKNLPRTDPHYYTGILDCVTKMYKHEGLSSFYKGILPPILAETPKRAVKFACFEQYKKLCMSILGTSTATPLVFSIAGFGAGLTEGLFVNPFEVVKVTLMANKARGKEVPSTWFVTRQIVREHGFGSRGLSKGLTATLARNGVFNMVYFGFYHSVKDIVPENKVPVLDFLRKLCIGFVAGCLGSCVNIPFDVAKSRIQGPQPVQGQIKYRTTTGAMITVYREEGFRALYKGLVPKILRLGPGGAIMLVVYEKVYHFLETKFI